MRRRQIRQHLVRCAECGPRFGSESCWTNITRHNDKRYRYEATTPHRYYFCYGMRKHRLHCRKRLYITADRLEAVVWSEPKRVLAGPGLIVASVEALDTQDGAGLAEEAAKAERELRSVQWEVINDN